MASDEIGKVVDLFDYKSGDPITMGDEGVYIDQKLSELLKVSVGDTFFLDGDVRGDVTVAGIYEHYTGHFIYMTPGYYENALHADGEPNAYLLNFTSDDTDTCNAIFEKLLDMSGVATTSRMRDTQDTYMHSMERVDFVVVIIILAAAALAMVVLFNLSNINITERQRELATIKLLGFYDGEVSAYVYRENIVLTVFGILMGCFMGHWLHIYLVRSTEIDLMMFGRQTAPSAYVYAAILTALFSLLVNVLAHFKMKKIDKIHRVQRLIADRYATAGSCAFFRIACNVLDGVLVSSIASLWGAELWIELLSGFLFAIIVAVVSVLVRPRTAGMAKPVGIMISNSRIVSLATKLTPFARIGGDKSGSKGPGRRSKDSDLSDDEELEKIQLEQGKAAIDRLVESNDFDPEVSEMLRNVLTLSDTLTREIMVPRTDMICMERDSTLSSALKLFSRSGFSRVPVIGEDVDDLIGVAYLKDAVRATAFNPAAMERAVESIVRQPLLVPESKPVDDLFHEMQRSRQHVAVVVDEYGGIAGMVTIEDAIEQIVGELEDEHDRTQRTEPEKIGDNKWKMPARTPIADLEEIFEIDIDEDDVDTVYGLLTKILGRVPIVGASAVTRGLRLTAVDSAGRRKKVSTIVVEPAHVEGGEENNKTHEETDGEPVEGDDTASKE